MLENADSVAVAQGILKTCRKALGRATECANTNAGLVQEAKQKLQLERENAAKALADARRQAQAPAEQAQAAAKKAQGWLEAGEQEASDYDGEAIKGGIEALKLSATAVGTQANQVAEIAIDASLAGSIEEAAEVETRVIEAVAITMGIAKKTREALETLRAAIQQQKDNQVQIEALQVASAQHTTETEKVKEVIQGTLTLLRELLKATEHSSEHLIGLNKQAETIEQRINEVVGQSLAHTTAAVEGKTLESVTTSVEQAKSSFEEAINLLEQVVKLDTQCREEIKKLTVEAEEQAQQAREDARKERENAREAKEKERQAVREAGTQAFPINRRSGSGTDRKARFEQAKAERESRREGGGNLRDRLKASRGRNAGGERPERPAGRRAGASDRIRRSPRPSGERGPQRGISRRPSRPTEETPEPAPDLQLPPEDPENDETVATPRRRLQRRSDTETRDRPSRTERGPRRERRPRDPESESVPAAEAPTEPGRPQRSRSADDLLARMKKKHDPKG
jgi:hypothetical protein